MSVAPISIAIADDSEPVRRALSNLLAAETSLELVGVAGDATEIVALCSRRHPHVVILDVKMPGGGGVEAVSGISRVSPATKTIAYSAHDDRRTRSAMLDAGATAFVAKGGPIGELLDAIAAAVTSEEGESSP